MTEMFCSFLKGIFFCLSYYFSCFLAFFILLDIIFFTAFFSLFFLRIFLFFSFFSLHRNQILFLPSFIFFYERLFSQGIGLFFWDLFRSFFFLFLRTFFSPLLCQGEKNQNTDKTNILIRKHI
mgnify:CR=1 FL=1